MENGPLFTTFPAAVEASPPLPALSAASSSSRSGHNGVLSARIGERARRAEEKTQALAPLEQGFRQTSRGPLPARGERALSAGSLSDGGVDGTRTRDLLRDRQAF
jgi:hypothetical protein